MSWVHFHSLLPPRQSFFEKGCNRVAKTLGLWTRWQLCAAAMLQKGPHAWPLNLPGWCNMTPPVPCAVQVRFVQVEAIKRQLDANHIVLLSNLAYSAAGEVLNCDIYSVATRAAVDLQASSGGGLTAITKGAWAGAQGACARVGVPFWHCRLSPSACTAGVLSLHMPRCLPAVAGVTCLQMQVPEVWTCR